MPIVPSSIASAVIATGSVPSGSGRSMGNFWSSCWCRRKVYQVVAAARGSVQAAQVLANSALLCEKSRTNTMALTTKLNVVRNHASVVRST